MKFSNSSIKSLVIALPLLTAGFIGSAALASEIRLQEQKNTNQQEAAPIHRDSSSTEICVRIPFYSCYR